MTEKISPLSQSKVKRNNVVSNLNYTNQDFYSLKTRLVNFINERFGPNGTEIPNTFNDFIESSVAIMLIENMAFIADTLSFKIDQNANENFIDTVTEIDNAFRLSKLVGFNPQPPIASKCMWSATINNILNTDLIMQTPVRLSLVSGNQVIPYELFQANSKNEPLFDQPITIPAGSLVNYSIIGLQGTTVEDAFIGDGSPGQSILLTQGPVTYESIRVIVDGVTWTQVDYFTDSQPRREYRVEYDSEYNAFVIFGNNKAGLIPNEGANIQIRYRVGGGTIGNVVTNAAEIQRQETVPGFGFYVPVTLTNYTKGEFGYSGDGIEDIRRKLPLWNKTQDRAVTGEDIKIICDQFSTPYYGQIGKSTAVLRNQGCAANIIDVYVLQKVDDINLQEANNDLKVALSEELDKKKMINTDICIKNGEIIKTDIQIDVTTDKFFRKSEQEIKQLIEEKINVFFNINNWDYKKTLKDIDLIKALSDVKEVQSFDINFITEDETNQGRIITANFNEIIRPDSITITFIYS